jgi:hypothetical protein
MCQVFFEINFGAGGRNRTSVMRLEISGNAIIRRPHHEKKDSKVLLCSSCQSITSVIERSGDRKFFSNCVS